MPEHIHRESVSEWTELLGQDRVITDPVRLAPYLHNVTGYERTVPGVLLPRSTEEVQQVVRIAKKYSAKLYPISGGQDLGSGSRLPVRDNCYIVDLSGMKRIEVNTTHGYAIIEAGVTQRDLYEYLQEREIPYFADATGAPSSSSLIGNGLRLGVGYHLPRFETLSDFEVVLGTGEVLRTGFSHYPNAKAAHLFKWGVGPYLDGLLKQGTPGIVTAATINLLPILEYQSSFLCRGVPDERMPELVDAIYELMEQGTIRSVPHISDGTRTGINLAPGVYRYLVEHGYEGGEGLRERVNSLFGPAWSVIGGLIGTKSEVMAREAKIKERLSGLGETRILTKDKILTGKKVYEWLSRLPGKVGKRAKIQRAVLEAVEPLFGVSIGKPTDEALRSVYWHAGYFPPQDYGTIENDGPGMIYYLPIIPAEGGEARYVVDLMREIAAEDPNYTRPLAITLNQIGKAHDVVTSIAFDKKDERETRAAHECSERLHRRLKEEGYIPYSVPIELMNIVVDPEDPFWTFARDLMRVPDPDEIIAPGRYKLF